MAAGDSLADFFVQASLERRKFDAQLKGLESDLEKSAKRLSNKLRPEPSVFQRWQKEANRMGLGEGGIPAMMRGGGALMAANVLAQTIDNVSDSLKKVRVALDHGGTKTEAFASVLAEAIPGVGDLAKAFRNLHDTIVDEYTEAGKAAKAERERRQRRDELADKTAERGKRSHDVVLEAQREAREAKRRERASAARTDAEKALIEAENERERELEELARWVQQNKPKVRGDELAAFDEAIRQKIEAINQIAEAAKAGKPKSDRARRLMMFSMDELWRATQEAVLEGGDAIFHQAKPAPKSGGVRPGLPHENPMDPKNYRPDGPVRVEKFDKAVTLLEGIKGLLKAGLPARFA